MRMEERLAEYQESVTAGLEVLDELTREWGASEGIPTEDALFMLGAYGQTLRLSMQWARRLLSMHQELDAVQRVLLAAYNEGDPAARDLGTRLLGEYVDILNGQRGGGE